MAPKKSTPPTKAEPAANTDTSAESEPVTAAERVQQIILFVNPYVDTGAPDAMAAYEMFCDGLHALIGRRPEALALARKYAGNKHGFSAEETNLEKIVELERLVKLAVGPHDPIHGQAPWPGLDATLREALGWHIRERIVRLFPKAANNISDVETLKGWFDHHVPCKPKKGEITTARIVAKIMLKAQLLGAHGTEEATLKRVTEALKRHTRSLR